MCVHVYMNVCMYDGYVCTYCIRASVQLSDFKSYAFAPQGSLLLLLIEHLNDTFLRRAFRFVVRPLNAAAHVYAGDLFDHLREAGCFCLCTCLFLHLCAPDSSCVCVHVCM